MSTAEMRCHVFAIAAGGKFKDGDMVLVDSDVSRVQCLSDGHGYWDSEMADYCGRKGKVTQVLETGDVKVRFADGETWRYHPAVVRKL
eukprot:5089932-Amphidinium_carterae.1